MRAEWIVVLAACHVPGIDLAGKSCPCPSGYSCDLATNTCMLGDAASAPDATDALADARESYRDVVLSDHPVAYWRLGDIDPIARDEIGSNDGAYSGACTQGAAGAIAGDMNTAVTFDGSTCKVTLPAAFPFGGTTPYSVEAWVSTTANAQFQMIFCEETRNATNPIDGYGLLVTPTTASGGFELEREISMAAIKTPIEPAANGYQHVVATYDGSDVALYVNGAFIGQSADTRTAAAITQLPIIGASVAGNPFTGTLDEIALYDTALSASRIAAHYAAGTQ